MMSTDSMIGNETILNWRAYTANIICEVTALLVNPLHEN